MPDEAQLIYDWNTVDAPPKPAHPVQIHDETLRDGIQGPSVRDPDIEHKLRFLHLADELGVGSIDLGLPASGPRAAADVERLAEEIRDQRMRIKPLCAARTLEGDIRPGLDAIDALPVFDDDRAAAGVMHVSDVRSVAIRRRIEKAGITRRRGEDRETADHAAAFEEGRVIDASAGLNECGTQGM